MNNSPFQNLPAELRTHIWELALYHQNPIQLIYTRPKVVAPKQLQRVKCLALLETCKALYTECRNIFYFINTFKVYSTSLLHMFQLQLSVKFGKVLIVSSSRSHDAELEDGFARVVPAFREGWALLEFVEDVKVKFEYTVRLGHEQWRTAKEITWFEEVVWDARNVRDPAELRAALEKLLR